jgi:two-component system response regulator DegU
MKTKNIKTKIRLLLVEDTRIIKDGIISMLKPYMDIEIVSASGKSENTIHKIQQLKPNVILLDLGLRSQNSLSVVELVRKEFPESKVIIMDLAPVQADIIQFVKAGASGFILKDATLDDFITTIRTVAEGGTVLPNNLNDKLFTQIVKYAIKGGTTNAKNSVRMTNREREIMEMIGAAMTNKEIAQKLHLSANTVKGYIQTILEKLALHTRLEIEHYSLSNGAYKTISDGISTANC